MLASKREYFESEAYVARTPSDPRHLNPVFPPGAKVVCVGSGGGWERETEGTSRFVAIDIDEDAGEFRKDMKFPAEFRLASGEQLPFGPGEFTFYMARGCVMYMNMDRFFAEANRVLAPDGQMWFTCHDFNHEWTHLLGSIAKFNIKDIIYRSYVLGNGLLYHVAGTQIRFPLNTQRMESFQTKAAIQRGLKKAGFSDVQFPKTVHGQFLVTARKTRA